MTVNEFFKLYEDGNSLADIAALYGISRQRVSQVLKTHTDYEPRPKSEALKLKYDKMGASRHSLKSLPLTKCAICNGKVSTTRDGGNEKFAQSAG